jgi:hypothetical protein
VFSLRRNVVVVAGHSIVDAVDFGGIALAQNLSAKKHLVLSQAVKAGGMILKSSGEWN